LLVIVAEGASITPLPQLPGDQSEQGVEPLPLLHRELSAEMCPPLGDGHAGLWSDVLQAKSAQKFPPNLTGERAAEQKVVAGLLVLVAQPAGGIRLKAMTETAFSRPQPAQEGQPKKELHFEGGPGFPNEFVLGE